MVSISISTTVCVLNIHFRGHKLTRVPNWVKKGLLIEVKAQQQNEQEKQFYNQQENFEPNYFCVNDEKFKHHTDNSNFGCSHKPNNIMYESSDIAKFTPKNSSLNRIENNVESKSVYMPYKYKCDFNVLNHVDSLPQIHMKKTQIKSYSRDSTIDFKDGKDNLEKIFKIIKRSTKLLEKSKLKIKINQIIYDEWKEVASRIDIILFLVVSTTVLIAPIILFGKFFIYDETATDANRPCGCEIK